MLIVCIGDGGGTEDTAEVLVYFSPWKQLPQRRPKSFYSRKV